MDNFALVTDALRDSLSAFSKLDQQTATRVVIALFGPTNSKRLAPMLDELARQVQAKL